MADEKGNEPDSAASHPFGGTVDKRIFTITCTTCQARLVVRSEAAIGTILECPRCESMVQVTPPPGWQPEQPAAQLSAGPPPLDRVAAVPLVLELEPATTSPLGVLLGHKWLLWGVASLATLVVVGGLWRLLSVRPEPVARETATQTGESKRSETATGGTVVEQPPKPQSVEVQPEPTPPETASTQPTPPAGAKPAETDPFPADADQADAADAVEIKKTVPAVADAVEIKKTVPAAADAVEIKKTAPAVANAVEIKKLPPDVVDVAARLADPIADIELTDVPLVKAVEMLAAIGGLPVTIEADELALLGVSPRVPIAVRLGSTTVGKALREVLTQRGLALAVENNQVIVAAPADYRQTLRNVRYTVADLTGDDKAAVAGLAALVQKLVAPESWQQAGGRGTIEAERSALVVVQSGDVHQQVLVFCEKLRAARGKPLRSRDNPQRFVLTTRLEQAHTILNRAVSANFSEPAPLAEVLEFLAEAAGCDILIDRAAMAAAETSDRVEIKLIAHKRPLAAVLAELLRPLGLTYRAVGDGTIQVTTNEAADERLELEFYPVERWLAKPNSPRPTNLRSVPGEGQGVRGESLAERLKARAAPTTWSDVGGAGEVYFDPPSQCLIVLQSQPAQAAIERLLRKAEGGERKAEGQ